MTRSARKRNALIVMLVSGLATAGLLAATADNGFYEVTVQETPGSVGIGVYTVTTELLHPATVALGPQNVLFGGGTPSTSWTTIHSYTSGTSYSQRKNLTLAAGAGPNLDLESFVVAGQEAALLPTSDGFETHYQILSGGGGGADDLDVFQTIRAVGTSFNDSAVEVSTEVFNLGSSPVEIGIRYLLDFQIGGGDDGPAFQLKTPDGPVEVLESDHPNPPNLTFEILDNNDPTDFTCQIGGSFNTPFPLFTVAGSVHGPTALQPTPPTLLQFTSWQHVSGLPGKTATFAAQDAFFYANGGNDASTCVISYDDSGSNYFWGEAQGNSLQVMPGQGVKVTAYLFAFLPGQPPTFPNVVEDCTDGIDNDGDGLIDGDDPDCAPLLIDLVSFETASARRGVKLTWTTATEIDNAGFLILKSRSPSGPFTPLMPELIPPAANGLAGASYEYEDRNVRRGELFYYKLVDVDISGLETAHGPRAGSWGKPRPDRNPRP